MSIFSSSRNDKAKESDLVHTTYGMYLGIPEAEAEANNLNINLSDVFEDYLDILNQISDGKFIILGRKGSGKSAIGEHIHALAEADSNSFCSFVKKSDINIEHIIQIGQKEGIQIEHELLYRWIILTQFIKLFTQNESLAHHAAMSQLQKFLERNRGFIDIKDYEIENIIKERGISINTEYIKRAAFYLGRKINTTESKAEFYKYIPDLENIVMDLLSYDKDNEYTIIFDDLDIGFNSQSVESKSILMSLLRIVKYYNIDLFARKRLSNARVIILLRNDIAKRLNEADSAKLLASYAIELFWYDEITSKNENNSLLKKFINTRIKYNLAKKKLIIDDPANPWKNFIDERSFWTDRTGKTAFKHIIDYTFYRPRDLLLFFKDINQEKIHVPICYHDVMNILLPRYASEMIRELKGELCTLYGEDIPNILFDNVLSKYRGKQVFTYEDIYQNICSYNIEDARNVINNLYDYSIIGNMDDNDNIYFKFRERSGEIQSLREDERFVLHNVLHAYYSSTKAIR